MNLPRFSEKTKFYMALAACLGLFAAHLMYIVKFAVNIPYWDEWEAIAPGGVVPNPSFSQIFAQHNEHRIVTTKLYTLLQYKINGWNVADNLALNFIVYGILVGVLAYLVRKSAPRLPAWVVVCFTVFLFSSLSWENHFWAFQSTFHFSLLFLFLSVLFLFNEKQTWQKIFWGILFSWIAIYSMSAGLVGSVVLAFGYFCFKLLRLRRRQGDERRPAEAAQMIVVLLLIGAAIGLYFAGYVKPAHHPPLSLPYTQEFWIYFFNLLSSGFGHRSANALPGFFIFLFIFTPAVGAVWKERLNLTAESFAVIVSILAVAASLCSITMGRAGFELSQSKSSRYCEIVGMLIPLSVAMWSIFLVGREKLRNRLLLIFWLCCAVTFVKHWNFPRTYQRLARERQIGAECVRDYYLKGGQAECLNIYPVPIAERLEFAKTLQLSFVEENIKRPNGF